MSVAMMRPESPLRRAFSVADVRHMIDACILREDERFELIEGDLVMMSAKGYAHELIKSAINIALARALPEGMTMGVEMTLQFESDTILEPDLAVFERGSLTRSNADFSHVRPGELLLAIEIAASSLVHDRGTKARLYSRYRVRELWVVDANERITWVHTGPKAEGWTSVVERGPEETLTTPAVPGFSIRLADLVPPI